MKTYRVEVVAIDTGKVVSVIGHKLSESGAECRVNAGLTRINSDKYFVRDVEEKVCQKRTS